MKKLLLLLLAISYLGCSDISKKTKGSDVSFDIVDKVGFKSVYARNGISVKLIHLKKDSYSFQINIADHTDTLDFVFNTNTQFVPKVLFGTDFVSFLTGASSYRYMTVAYLDNEKGKIIIRNFTTSRDVSSSIDGVVFSKGKYFYFYDIARKDIRRMSATDRKTFCEAILYNGDSISIIGEKVKCKVKDFSVKCQLLPSVIVR